MDIYDLIFTPIFLIFLIFILVIIRTKSIKDPILKKHFIRIALLKVFGALSLGLMYQFYYKGGDTFTFYKLNVVHFYEAFFDSPSIFMQMLFYQSRTPFPSESFEYLSAVFSSQDAPSMTVIKIASVVSLFCGNIYSIIAILFGMFALSGSVALYNTFIKIYPQLSKVFIYIIFYIPSVIFWSSGLLKDTITFGSLGWFIFGFYRLVIQKEKIVQSLIIIILSALIIKSVKMYILMAFFPAALIWMFLIYIENIKSIATKMLLVPIMVVIALGCGLVGSNYIAKDDSRYELENISGTLKVTNEYLTSTTKIQNGSVYDLGVTDFSPLGLLKIFPNAVFVTLFRPFVWECRNAQMLLSGFESLLFMFYTFTIIKKIGLVKFFLIAKLNPSVAAFLIYSLVFAFSVGLSSGNFGTLVRYKIPILPFYLAALFIAQYEYKRMFTKMTTNDKSF